MNFEEHAAVPLLQPARTAVSLTALTAPPMFVSIEPLTGADLGCRTWRLFRCLSSCVIRRGAPCGGNWRPILTPHLEKARTGLADCTSEVGGDVDCADNRADCRVGGSRALP